MNELFPILGGLIAGLVATAVAPRTRLQVSIMLGSVVAVSATLASGEYRIGWQFVLIDAVLAIGAALCMPVFLCESTT